MSTDVRSLPDSTLNLYLYGLGAWAVALLALLPLGRIELAIPLSYLVALWQAGLTIWWGPRMLGRYSAGEFTRAEADEGVRSVGKLLSASSLLPAIVFMARDPLQPSSWTATLSIVAVAAIGYFGSSLAVRLSNRWTHTLVLAAAALTLPINATGAVSFAAAYGLFDRFLE
ncbi:MAG: hypothetical protein H6737_27130 [Alphaproteobacteria bacterium]|nr:hypothetical protein [Alphaproteobacteria bacterium]